MYVQILTAPLLTVCLSVVPHVLKVIAQSLKSRSEKAHGTVTGQRSQDSLIIFNMRLTDSSLLQG